MAIDFMDFRRVFDRQVPAADGIPFGSRADMPGPIPRQRDRRHALADLLSDRVQLMFSSVVAILPHVKAGKLRRLAITAVTRRSSMPGLPTLAVSGLAGYEASSWYGVLAPA